MEILEAKLQEIEALLKAAKLPGMPSPFNPKMPKPPTITPTSQKNPVDVAQQITDPATKKVAVKQAKNFIKTDKNGQWKLETA